MCLCVCASVRVCLIWGKERERSIIEVCVLSAELGVAFGSFAWAATPHCQLEPFCASVVLYPQLTWDYSLVFCGH